MRTPKFTKTKIEAENDIWKGQSIERYVEQCETTNQPIDGMSPIIFTARKDGVKAEYNIRTDRFELAREAMDKVAGSYRAQRAEYIKSTEESTEKSTEKSTEQSA